MGGGANRDGRALETSTKYGLKAQAAKKQNMNTKTHIGRGVQPTWKSFRVVRACARPVCLVRTRGNCQPCPSPFPFFHGPWSRDRGQWMVHRPWTILPSRRTRMLSRGPWGGQGGALRPWSARLPRGLRGNRADCAVTAHSKGPRSCNRTCNRTCIYIYTPDLFPKSFLIYYYTPDLLPQDLPLRSPC